MMAREKLPVRVKRSSGEIEEGWFVSRIENGEALVLSSEGLRKNVSLGELKEWNSEEKTEDIEEEGDLIGKGFE